MCTSFQARVSRGGDGRRKLCGGWLRAAAERNWENYDDGGESSAVKSGNPPKWFFIGVLENKIKLRWWGWVFSFHSGICPNEIFIGVMENIIIIV